MAATLAAGLTLIAPEVMAETKIVSTAQAGHSSVHSKTDRVLVSGKGSDCSSLGWPHYEKNCQFDMRLYEGEPQKVRIIALR